MSSTKKYEIIQPLIIASMVALGMFFGYLMADKQAGTSLLRFAGHNESDPSDALKEIYQLINEKYLYEPDPGALEDKVIGHIFSNLDPYSLYIPKSELDLVNSTMEGNYQGLGIEMVNVRDTFVIINILPGSPAKKAGLKKLDRILTLDKESVAGKDMDLGKFRQKVMHNGKKPMELGIYRKSQKKKMVVSFIPEKVETPSISQFAIFRDSILYIRLDQFHAKTYQEFMLLVEKHQKDEFIPALILDVRDNPGGYLTEVTKILSEFFDDSGKLLVSTVVKDGRAKEYKSTGRSFYKFGKIIVLTNEFSASGSEVLAGVVQDWDLGWVIGEKSYGKGLVQEQFPLSNGGAVRLTVAGYYLPTGRSIQHALDLDENVFSLSAQYSEKKDTFYTLSKKRKITVSEGVMPDLQIKDELFGFLRKGDQEAWADSDRLLIDFLEENAHLLEMPASTFFEKFAFKPEELKRYHKLLPQNPNQGDQQKLTLLLKFRLGQILYSENESLKFIHGFDPVIRAALKKMSEPSWVY